MSGSALFSAALGQVTSTLRPRCHSLLDAAHSETLSLSSECLAELNTHINRLLSDQGRNVAVADENSDDFIVVNGVEIAAEAYDVVSDREASALRLQFLQRVYDIVQLLLRLRVYTPSPNRSRLSSVLLVADDAIDAVSTVSTPDSNSARINNNNSDDPLNPLNHPHPHNLALPLSADLVDLSHFRHLQQLSLERISAASLRGIHQLSRQLRVLRCSQCTIDRLSQLLGERRLLSWQQLRELRLINCRGLCCLDETLRSACELQLVEVYRCQQLVDIAGVWQLPRLQRLEVNCCRLRAVGVYQPMVAAARSLNWLSLSDNQLTSIEGVEHLYCLQHLDVSHNLIMSDSHLWPLSHLNRLKWLNLHGNPVQCAQGSRASTIGRLHRHCLHTDFFLNPVRLRVSEITARTDDSSYSPLYPLSSSTFPSQRGSSVSALVAVSSAAAAAAEAVVSHRYLSRNRPLASQQFAQPAINSACSTLNSTPASVRRVKRRPRANIAEIVQVSMDESGVNDEDAGRTCDASTADLVGSVVSADSAASCSLGDTRDISVEESAVASTRHRLQQLREQLGAEHWLHSGGAWMVHQILGLSDQGQGQSVDQQQEQGQAVPDGDSELPAETSKDGSRCSPAEEVVSAVLEDESDIYTSRVSSSPLVPPRQASEGVTLEASPFDGPHSGESSQSEDEDENDILCCVTIDDVIDDDKASSRRLLVTQSAVKEKSQLSNCTIQQWDLASVEACHVTKLKPLTVQLNFDTVQKKRRERNYIMQSSEWRSLNEVLAPILEARLAAELMHSLLQCMKCGAEFPEVMAKTAATRTGRRSGGFREIKTCPNCGSDLLISVDRVSHPNERVTNSDPSTPIKSGKSSGANKREKQKKRSRSKELATALTTSTPIQPASNSGDIRNSDQLSLGKSGSSSDRSPDVTAITTVNTESSSISVLSSDAAPLPSNDDSSIAKCPAVDDVTGGQDYSDGRLETSTSPLRQSIPTESQSNTATTHQRPCDLSNSRSDTPTLSHHQSDWSNSRSDTPTLSQPPCDWSVPQKAKSTSSVQRGESDVEVISNPSESSIEVLSPQTERADACHPAECSASCDATQFDDVINACQATDSAQRTNMGDSSSSGSLSTSINTVRYRSMARTQSPQTDHHPHDSNKLLNQVYEWLTAEPASDQLYELGSSCSGRYQFWCMSPRRLDHRIRLYLDFHILDSQREQIDWCMLTSGVVDFTTFAESPLFLVATTVNLHVLRIFEPITEDISRWLKLHWSARLTAVTSIECFFGQQAVYLECNRQERRLLAVLRDQHRVQLLLQMFQESCPSVVLRNHWQIATMDRLSSLLAPAHDSIESSSFEDPDIRHMILTHQYLLDSQCIRPVTLCVTTAEILLLDGCLWWMAPPSGGSKHQSLNAQAKFDHPPVVYERNPLHNLRSVEILRDEAEENYVEDSVLDQEANMTDSRGNSNTSSFPPQSHHHPDLPVCHFIYSARLIFSSSSSVDSISCVQLLMTSRAAISQLIAAVRDVQRSISASAASVSDSAAMVAGLDCGSTADSFIKCGQLTSSSAHLNNNNNNNNTSSSNNDNNNDNSSSSLIGTSELSTPDMSPVVFRLI